MSEAYIDLKGNVTKALATRIAADLLAFKTPCRITLVIDEEKEDGRGRREIMDAIRTVGKRGFRVVGLVTGTAKVGASTVLQACQIRAAYNTAKLTRKGRSIGTVKALKLGLLDEVYFPQGKLKKRKP